MSDQVYVEYDSNNSGGSWWLSDQNWRDLEKAGWRVVWAGLTEARDKLYRPILDEAGLPALNQDDDGIFKPVIGKDGEPRYMGALATKAYRAGLSLRDAVDEWEEATGLSSTDAGCPCCGQPHDFTEYTNGKETDSGPNAEYGCSW